MNIRSWIPAMTGHMAAFAGTAIVGTAVLLAQGAATKDEKAAQKTQAKTPAGEVRTAAAPGDAKAAPQRRNALHGMQVDTQGDQLRISSIEERGAAAQAGFRQNDRIVSVDGRVFANNRQLNAYLAGQTGRRVPFIVERDGQKQTVQYVAAPAEGDSAWLGVYLEEGDGKVKGARITHLYPAGPAARAGLHVGDVITQIEGQKIDDSTDLVDTVQELKPQTQAQFAIVRNDQQMKVPVLLGSRNSNYQISQRGYDSEGQNQEPDDRGRSYSHDPYGNVPPYAMQLEHERRSAEQHERIENEIRALRDEIAKLREELKKK
jgi:predicted metalloprotease with PDZ domain